MASPQDKDRDTDLAVLSYLRKRGFKDAEAHFRQEAKITTPEQMAFNSKLEIDASVSNQVLFYNSPENTPSRYFAAYAALRDWIQSSLDLYKQELMKVLYPMFVHCYLDLVAKSDAPDQASKFMEKFRHEHEDHHSPELLQLQSITTPLQMQENDSIKVFRSHKFNISLSSYSFELLMSFLSNSKYLMLISIINQYFNIKVYGGQPRKTGGEEDESCVITGVSEQTLDSLNRREIYWGLFDDMKPKEEEPEPKEASPANKKPKSEKKAKKEKEKAQEEEKNKPRSKVPLPKMSESMEQEMLEDIKNRVPLSATDLPSICFFTFFNTYQSLNTVDISRDARMVVGGFSDSSLKLWDLKKEEKRNLIGLPTKKESKKKRRESEYTALHGHSGPVYGTAFTPDNLFVLSASEDSTVRLWSMDTGTNVVAYKGHNYPVWAVDSSPVGYYFATASHDRTSRLWCTRDINPLRVFAGHLSDVNCVKFHPNCNYVVTGSSDKSLRLWEIHTGACIRIFTGHYAAIYSVAVSPDGRYLASAGEDRNIILWDLATSKKLKTLTGHTKTIWSLDFSAEGSLLASGSADQTVRLWDVNKACGLTGGTQLEVGGSEEMVIDTIAPSNTTEPAITTSTTTASTASPATTNGVKTENGDVDVKNKQASPELVKTFSTKQTPVFKVAFTRRNLLLASGPFSP